MSQQPSFTTPGEAIEFIRACLQQDDARKLYAAFKEETSEFWKGRLFQYLRELQNTETLERIFLEDGQITTFPEHETVLHLGGHSPRTNYLHIKLVKSAGAWVLDSIHVCR